MGYSASDKYVRAGSLRATRLFLQVPRKRLPHNVNIAIQTIYSQLLTVAALIGATTGVLSEAGVVA